MRGLMGGFKSQPGSLTSLTEGPGSLENQLQKSLSQEPKLEPEKKSFSGGGGLSGLVGLESDVGKKFATDFQSSIANQYGFSQPQQSSDGSSPLTAENVVGNEEPKGFNMLMEYLTKNAQG